MGIGDAMEIDAATKICALIGNPVEHSLSPALHNAAFHAADLNYAYVAFRVEEVGPAVAGLRALNVQGASVTIPHKVSVIDHLDRLDEGAERIGAVNTIANQGDALVGYNTDGDGALDAMRGAGFDPAGRRVLILGSGGAARGIAFTLAAKAEPAVLGILGIETPEVDRLVQDLGERTSCPTRGGSLSKDALARAMKGADALINCTPVGMDPRSDESLVPADLMGQGLFVFDVVYNPLRTRLLQEAESRGLKTLSGIEMFICQAAAQFELWTGAPAPREVMRAAIESRMGGKGGA